ncbi:hypothetical protein F3Y22_tig00111027pilonHSYRG00228 [Hibiscus syriacus]|uniref:Uncharacterized protein n=1 Tax=Hibiscus syriacus TaxID=106335 RepID=A0A6A2Z5G4_HIBSY|nr:hypothetical protein F3Y22_tig00111027pilonHSYRG00228 [Hibiscus syriacus]
MDTSASRGYVDEGGDIGRESQDMKCVGGYSQKLAYSDIFKDMNVGIVLDEGLPSQNENYRLFYAEKAQCAWRTFSRALKASGGSGLRSSICLRLVLKSEGEVVSINMAFLKAGTPSPTSAIAVLCLSLSCFPAYRSWFRYSNATTADIESLEKRIAEEWAPALHEHDFEVETLKHSSLGKTNCSNPWWILMEEAIKKANEKIGKPEIFSGATDARYFRQLGLPAIVSIQWPHSFLLHDHNEGLADMRSDCCVFNLITFLNKAEYLRGIEVYESIIKAYTSYIPPGRDGASRRIVRGLKRHIFMLKG